MNITEISAQWPALALLIGLCGYLLRLLQTQYLTQIQELRADRDAWKEIAERGSWLAQQSLHQAERSQGATQQVKSP